MAHKITFNGSIFILLLSSVSLAIYVRTSFWATLIPYIGCLLFCILNAIESFIQAYKEKNGKNSIH